MIVLYIAQTLDGFIAAENGSVDWLEPFNSPEYGCAVGYNEFLAGVEYIVMGRKTYDQILTFGSWPYAGKKTFVFSSTNIKNPPENADVVHETKDIETFVKQTCKDKRVWLLGGSQLVKAFLEANLIDEYMITTMPVFMGKGIRLFPESNANFNLECVSATLKPKGLVDCLYKRL